MFYGIKNRVEGDQNFDKMIGESIRPENWIIFFLYNFVENPLSGIKLTRRQI